MGYLAQFKNDLFVSYRRVSNETQDNWVDVFCKALQASLRELVGDVTIWRDQEQLRTGQPWRKEVAEALDGAAIFLAIISRTYLDSDECLKELDHFLGWLKDPTRGNGRRIVPIFKQPPKAEQKLPHEMGEIHRHDFFRCDPPGSARFRELGPNRDDEDRREFWATLERVAQDIMVALEELKGDACQRAVGNVFIARVGPELQMERERLRSDLLQRGYLVVPEQEYLWNADDHRARITKDLESAQLCIHLVGSTRSIEPAAASRAKLQIELAHETMKRIARPAPLVWIQPADEVDKGIAELLDYVKSDLADQGVEYWQGGLEDFKTHIFDKLPPVSPRSVASRGRAIAVVVEEGDIGDLGALKALLVDKLGLDPKPVKFCGTSPKDAARVTRTLADCRQCLIFWGRQPEEWVLDLLDSETLSGHIGRDRTCVYAVAPETPEKKSFQTTKARTIVESNGLNEPDLRAFLADTPTTA
jgi:hypothetical protein